MGITSVVAVDSDFEELIQKLIRGDAQAAEQIVRDHEPEIRRIVRFRLRDPRLRRVIDSTDICQSVFGRFFVLASLGRFDFESPRDLVKLLTKMATNKIIDRHRSEVSQRDLTNHRLESTQFSRKGEPVDKSMLPDTTLEYQELLNLAREKLSEDEHAISELRNEGLTWLDVSRRLGESPQALRKRFERACHRIVTELGIE